VNARNGIPASTGVRAFLVDDSAVSRTAFRRLLLTDPAITVVGEAVNGREALGRIPEARPDIVLMDIVMPVMDGIAATRELMSSYARPVLIISDQIGGEADMSFEALRAGALDVIGKPSATELADQATVAALCRKVKMLAEIPVVTRNRRRASTQPAVEQKRVDRPPAEQVSMVCIGASAGGPPALQRILSTLPPEPRWPVVVVQHMTPGFTTSLVSWLQRATGCHVVLATGGAAARPGMVYIAPDNSHLEVVGRRMRLRDAAPLNGHRPSVDALLGSVAITRQARETVAVLLTGMGRDGADGLAELRAAGAWTLAQDQASSAVWGMPEAAVKLNAACEVLPLDEIATFLASIA
jgi:two-component system chemotaxis response regulator CheB